MTIKPTQSRILRSFGSTIRQSTDADLPVIYDWLEDQRKRGVSDSLFCNWASTNIVHKESNLLVYIDEESGVPVAYQWGDLLAPGALEVRADMRGRGIGRRFVEYRIAEAYEKDECLLWIQCALTSSIPFWKRMGFTMIDCSGTARYAYRILEKKNQLPTDAVPINVSIRFFPQSRRDRNDVEPLCSATPVAACTADGIVHLSERVHCHKRQYPTAGDPVVEIEVAGQQLYCEKAKYPDAERRGVRHCTNGFYIDSISPAV